MTLEAEIAYNRCREREELMLSAGGADPGIKAVHLERADRFAAAASLLIERER